jgi:uncharacterized iron-regulated protein
MIMIAISSVPTGVIHHGETVVTAEEMISILSETDKVFVGEMHDDTLAHQWELYIWQSLASGDRVLALEMFETDVQLLLNDYLSGAITEEAFLLGSRPWENYAEDYSPLVEFAKENGSGVIAANVPRTYAAMVARGGFEAVASEPFFQELRVDSSSVLYREMFLATIDALGGEMNGMMPMNPLNMYRAQLLKDAVMASSVSEERCLFINGSFHSDFHSGIPDQLPPDTDFITVKILAEGEEFSSDAADFVIVRPAQE